MFVSGGRVPDALPPREALSRERLLEGQKDLLMAEPEKKTQ